MKPALLIFVFLLMVFKKTRTQTCRYYSGVEYFNRYHPSYEIYNYIICTNLTFQNNTSVQVNYAGLPTTEYIMCKNCNIPIIPADRLRLVGIATKMYLNNSNIQNINPDAFSGMSYLRELYLNNNNISNIAETANYLINLKILDLSNNTLLNVNNHSFVALTKLEELNLSKNRLYELSGCIFCTLTSLKKLDLSYNWIYNIFSNSFANQRNLQILLLNNNFIVQLPRTLLENTTHLQTLDVSSNKLPDFNFDNLPGYLKMFNISHNVFEYMKDWSWLNNVQTVDLGMNDLSNISGIGKGIVALYFSGNYLETLDSSIFNEPEDLTCLDLCNSSIQVITGHAFANLPRLEKLNLSRNQIQNLPVGCFKNLTSLWELRLSHNYLSNLEYGTFAGLDNLTVLFLDNNKIKIIHERSFYVLRKLKALYLTNNAITTLDAEKFIMHLRNINTLGLNSNDWICNDLFNVIQVLTYSHIGFFNGTDYHTENIHGITCRSADKQDSQEIPDDEIGKSGFGYFRNTVETRHKDDFLNSKSYKPLDKNVIKSTFSNFLESIYINSSLFDYFQKDFKKTNFFKYFNTDFFNSSFFKYFDRDFKHSGFFRKLNSSYLKSVDSSIESNFNDHEDEYFLTTENPAEALEFHSNVGSDQQLAIFVNKITICIIINLAVLAVIIILFLFVLFRKQYKLKFLNSKQYSDSLHSEDFDL